MPYLHRKEGYNNVCMDFVTDSISQRWYWLYNLNLIFDIDFNALKCDTVDYKNDYTIGVAYGI